MIKYKLICNECKNIFASWFASSKEYEKLKKKRLLACHICNSQKVEKTIMDPQLISIKKKTKYHRNKTKIDTVKKIMKDYQKFIKNNLEFVGENFAYEARSIHYNKNKQTKGVYGKASKQDLKELKEEGIDIQMIPWLDDKDN